MPSPNDASSPQYSEPDLSTPTYEVPDLAAEPTYEVPDLAAEPTYEVPDLAAEPTYEVPNLAAEPTYEVPDLAAEPTYEVPDLSPAASPAVEAVPDYPIDNAVPDYPIDNAVPDYPIDNAVPDYAVDGEVPDYAVDDDGGAYAVEGEEMEEEEEAEAVAVAEPSAAIPVGEVQTPRPNTKNYTLKPMEGTYVEGEKNAARRMATVDGQQVEVRNKQWMRDKMDDTRAKAGQALVDDATWDRVGQSTQYMNDQQRDEHALNMQPGQDANGVANKRLPQAIVDEAFAKQDKLIADYEAEAASIEGDPTKLGRYRQLMQQADHFSQIRDQGKVSAIFVMDGGGQLYGKGQAAAVGGKDEKNRASHVHHASFLAGEAVAGAGEMVVDRQGFIKEITDRSGHYKPGEAQTTQTLQQLQQDKVNLDNTKFTLDRGVQRTKGMAQEYLAGGEQTFQTRHTVADQIKAQGKQVRAALDKDATQRATQVRQATEAIQRGANPAAVSDTLKTQSAKAAADLAPAFDKAVQKQLPSVREKLGKNLGAKPGGAAGAYHAGPGL